MSAPPSGSHVRASQPGSGLLREVGSLGEGGVGWRQEPVEEEVVSLGHKALTAAADPVPLYPQATSLFG